MSREIVLQAVSIITSNDISMQPFYLHMHVRLNYACHVTWTPSSAHPNKTVFEGKFLEL